MKKEYIVLALVIVVLGAYLYFQNSDSTHYTLPTQPELKTSSISKIEIAKKDSVIHLIRKKDEWVVGEKEYPADKSKVTPILDMLKDIKLTALISESENYARYELEDDRKITVTAWNEDKVVRKIDIGKAASSFRHTFVKFEGNKNVYHASDNLKSTVNKTEEMLTDKTVLTFKPDGAYSVKITDGEKTFAFTKKMDEVKVDVNKKEESKDSEKSPEEYWASETGEKKDKSSVEAFIRAFSNLECNKYVDDITKATLTEPIYSVTVTTVNKPNTLSVFRAEKDKDLICTSSANDFVFTLSSEKLDKFKELFEKI